VSANNDGLVRVCCCTKDGFYKRGRLARSIYGCAIGTVLRTSNYTTTRGTRFAA
jgi:hypothetical protein